MILQMQKRVIIIAIVVSIKQSELDEYLQAGWQQGRPDKFKEEQQKRFQRYIWKCDGIEFK